MNSELYRVLQAREQRAEKRNSFSQQGLATLSLCLNVPGYPKSNRQTEYAFSVVEKDLEVFLKAHRIVVHEDAAQNFTDDAGQLFLVPLVEECIPLVQLKKLTEQFEQTHSLGRILDVDVFDKEGKPVSSGKQKPCIICHNKAAVDCMREQRHSYEHLREVVFSRIEDFGKKHRTDFLAQKLSGLVTRALLYEISLSPKPGLVDFLHAGSHRDMNYYSFLDSTSALSPFWAEFAKAGTSFSADLSLALPLVRQIGLKAERAMFAASQGVNTQKGLVFLLGLSLFSLAYVLRENKEYNESALRKTVKDICKGLVERELGKKKSSAASHGEITFRKYGVQGAGARYQAQQGFPLVFENALPYLEQNLKGVSFLNRDQADGVLHKTLFKIMSHLDDSNVLYRKGANKAAMLKYLSKKAFLCEGKYEALSEFCLKENISPGGSADMLAVSLFFYFVKKELRALEKNKHNFPSP